MYLQRFLVRFYSFILIFAFSLILNAENSPSKTDAKSFFENYKFAFSLDPFPIGARGLAIRSEFEIMVLDSLSVVFPIRGSWLNSNKLAYLFRGGYGHIDPYTHINNIAELLGSKNTTINYQVDFGVGIKLYTNGQSSNNGFYIKPNITVGFSWLTYNHVGINKTLQLKGGSIGPDTIVLPIDDPKINAQINTFVFTPEITVGYQMLFYEHLQCSLELGAKYRLFADRLIEFYVPEIAGIEPTFSLMIGYLW